MLSLAIEWFPYVFFTSLKNVCFVLLNMRDLVLHRIKSYTESVSFLFFFFLLKQMASDREIRRILNTQATVGWNPWLHGMATPLLRTLMALFLLWHIVELLSLVYGPSFSCLFWLSCTPSYYFLEAVFAVLGALGLPGWACTFLLINLKKPASGTDRRTSGIAGRLYCSWGPSICPVSLSRIRRWGQRLPDE